MKIKLTTNKKFKADRKIAKLRAERDRVALWHKKFAWRPLKITVKEESEDHATVVWFEWVYQKAHVRDWEWRALREFRWTRHPEKEYFKKKLAGKLEREEQFGGEDMAMQASGTTQGPSAVLGGSSK
jgi:hypothetical protein